MEERGDANVKATHAFVLLMKQTTQHQKKNIVCLVAFFTLKPSLIDRKYEKQNVRWRDNSMRAWKGAFMVD